MIPVKPLKRNYTQSLAILGSTGSIGVNALKVISSLKGRFEIAALSADSNIKLLAAQASRFRPKIISVGDKVLAAGIKKLLPKGTKVVFGREGLNEIVSRSDIDTVLFAISGSSCIVPLVRAIEAKKRIALANKESLVSAGSKIMKLAAARSVEIIPVDSEHSAIFQCLEGKRSYLSKIYLTGSGGPLLNIPKEKFDAISQKSILKHPKWRMGKKISVDSATMMNKGLEIIEAHYLFGVNERDIEVLIHPEAIVHSLIELIDGTLFAQLGIPDMRIPIQYALTYPERARSILKKLDLLKVKTLSFKRPDFKKFPCLALAREAVRRGGTYPAVLNASDEEAVRIYLDGAIPFSKIPKVIEKTCERHKNVKDPTLNEILKVEEWAKEEARSLCYR